MGMDQLVKKGMDINLSSLLVLCTLFAQLFPTWYLDRSDFHLSSFCGVVITFPSSPVYSISIWLVLAMMVQTIQVGTVAACVPPRTFVQWSTVSTVLVVITIFSGERRSSVLTQRITSRPWTFESNNGHKHSTRHWENIQKVLKSNKVVCTCTH